MVHVRNTGCAGVDVRRKVTFQVQRSPLPLTPTQTLTLTPTPTLTLTPALARTWLPLSEAIPM